MHHNLHTATHLFISCRAATNTCTHDATRTERRRGHSYTVWISICVSTQKYLHLLFHKMQHHHHTTNHKCITTYTLQHIYSRRAATNTCTHDPTRMKKRRGHSYTASISTRVSTHTFISPSHMHVIPYAQTTHSRVSNQSATRKKCIKRCISTTTDINCPTLRQTKDIRTYSHSMDFHTCQHTHTPFTSPFPQNA